MTSVKSDCRWGWNPRLKSAGTDSFLGLQVRPKWCPHGLAPKRPALRRATLGEKIGPHRRGEEEIGDPVRFGMTMRPWDHERPEVTILTKREALLCAACNQSYQRNLLSLEFASPNPALLRNDDLILHLEFTSCQLDQNWWLVGDLGIAEFAALPWCATPLKLP